MPTILLSIPNYVYSTDLLRTRYLSSLAEKFRVIVLLPMDHSDYIQHPNIIYVTWNLKFPDFWAFWGKTIRVPLIRIFDHEPLTQRNYLLSFGHWKRKLLRRLAFLFPKGFWNPDFIFRLEQRFLPRSSSFTKLIETYHPVLMVTPTPGFNDQDAELITLSKRAGIRTAAADFSWDNLTSTGKHLRRTDYLICWTPVLKEYAIKIHHYPEDRVFVSGIPRFDHYFRSMNGEQSRDEFLRSKGLDPKEKTILITTVTKGNYFDEPTIIRNLITARSEGKFPGTPNIFVRIHPKEDNYPSYQELTKFERVHIERGGKEMPKEYGLRIEMDEEDLANLKDTLRYSDININYLSTLSIESCIFDKPVVNIGFPPYYRQWYRASHYKPLVDAGAVKIASSMEGLVQLISEYLRHPEMERSERASIVKSHVHFTDGQSYQRSVQFLEQIATS